MQGFFYYRHILALFLTILMLFLGRFDTEASASTDRLLLSRPLIQRWSFLSDQTINLAPATDGDRVYLPLAQGVVVSLQVLDGRLIWKTEVGGEMSAAPTADERGVYIASETAGLQGKRPQSTGSLRALGRESGVTLWIRTFPTPLRIALAVNQSTIYGCTKDGKIYSVRKNNGDLKWVRQTPFSFSSSPTLAGGNLFIGTEDGQLISFDLKTGITNWRYRTQGAVIAQVAVSGGLVYFGSNDGYVYAVGEADGRLRWRSRTGAAVQSVLIVQSGLLIASLDNFVYLLSPASGDRLWKKQLAGRPVAEPLATFDGVLFTPLSSDSYVVLDLHDGKQLNSLAIGDENIVAATPIIARDLLLLTTRNGLLAFSQPLATSQ